jgi:DHA2 family multidrug resistance protein
VLEEGNSKDWFSSRLLVYLSIASAISLGVLLWWQLSSRNKQPVIELRVLRNRQLLASIFCSSCWDSGSMAA